MKARLLLLTALLAASPAPVLACPICFGGAESDLLDAARLGVLALGTVTALVLAAFARWFLKVRALQREEDAP